MCQIIGQSGREGSWAYAMLALGFGSIPHARRILSENQPSAHWPSSDRRTVFYGLEAGVETVAVYSAVPVQQASVRIRYRHLARFFSLSIGLPLRARLAIQMGATTRA